MQNYSPIAVAVLTVLFACEAKPGSESDDELGDDSTESGSTESDSTESDSTTDETTDTTEETTDDGGCHDLEQIPPGNECDPLEQDCGAGMGCYSLISSFVCHAYAADAVGEGTLCEFLDDCLAGTTCVSQRAAPACGGAACCVAFCDLDCPVCDVPGSHCVAERPIAGFEDVGLCLAE